MNVSAVVLLLALQLMAAAVQCATNETVNANAAAAPNATAAAVNPSNRTATTTTTATTTNTTNTGTAAAATPKLETPLKTTKLTEVTGAKDNNNNTAEHPTVLQRKVTNTGTATVSAGATSTTTLQTPITNANKQVADGVSLSDIKSNNNNKSSNNVTAAADAIGSASNNNSSATATNTTTTTTSTTTTKRPQKPLITMSTDVHVPGEKNNGSLPGKESHSDTSPEPEVQSVQEQSSLNSGENEYIVPIVTVMLTVPLAIAVFILMYRRFRDLWSTRHYRRMDFLVDGMYND